MSKQKGNMVLIGIIIGVLLLGGGFILYQNSQKKKTAMIKDEKKTDEAMMEKSVLAGKTAPYLEFNQTDYEKAKKEGKIIFLDFYANWCPICRGEAPELQAGFDELTRDDIVGFRVNYNDSETDENEKQLAKEFGITYQHTKVILKDGKTVLKDGETWDKEKFLETVNKI